MKTEKLYYKDAYIKEFSAFALLCESCERGYDVVLDKTAFFAEGGGQTSDTGVIGNANVFDVQQIDGVIHHYTDTPVEVNKELHCALNFEERFDKMQQHTAEHIVSGLLHSLFGSENVGFHLGHLAVTVDTSLELSREQLLEVERLANEAVYKNLPVKVAFPSDEELASLEYRSKLELLSDVRIVNIEGYDSCACCAPHVASTGEIGLIKLTDFVKHKGGLRISMLAGRRAYDYVLAICEQAEVISRELSAPKEQISGEVIKLKEARAFSDCKLSSFAHEMAALIAESYREGNYNLVIYQPAFDSSSMRALLNALKRKVSGTLVGLTGEEKNYKYVLMSESESFASEVKRANDALGGKGGGRAPMATGFFTATLREIKEYFKSE